MRLPYMPTHPPAETSTAAAYTQLSARRSPKPLQSLDLTLLHSPQVASGWSSFLGSIRSQTSLPAVLRELCICRVAVLNNAAYEWEQHAPILSNEDGIGERVLEEIRNRKAWQGWDGAESVNVLTENQRAVLAFTDAMTVSVRVNEEIFANLKRLFTDKEVVEVTATVAAYNCVSRFLVALDVGEMSDKGPE